MNTQQLRDLVQKAYYKQRWPQKRAQKPQQFLTSTRQHHELALEGTQRQDNAKPPHREWNAPPSNRERDSHADTRPEQRYDRWKWTAWTSTLTWTTLGEVMGPSKASWESVGKGRGTRFSLTSCQTKRQWQLNKSATGNSIISPHSQRTVNTRISGWTWNPPESPATELTLTQHPILQPQQRPTNTCWWNSSSSWKCCLSHLPFLRRTPDQVWHPKRSSQTPAPQWPKRCPHHSRCITWRVLDLSCPPPNPTVAAVTRRQHATGEHTPALLHYHTTSVRCWRSPHPHMRIRHFEPWQLTCQTHLNIPFPIRTWTHPPSSASSTLSTTCCICKTVSTHMSLSHSLRHSS